MTALEGQKSLHDLRFPGESQEYRRARDELLQAEIDLRRQTEAVSQQRRDRKPHQQDLRLGQEPVPFDSGRTR